MKQQKKQSAVSTAANFQAGDLVDEREAADVIFGDGESHLSTMRNWRSLGKGPPYYKIGDRIVRYHRSDLAAFIVAKRTVHSNG